MLAGNCTRKINPRLLAKVLLKIGCCQNRKKNSKLYSGEDMKDRLHLNQILLAEIYTANRMAYPRLVSCSASETHA